MTQPAISQHLKVLEGAGLIVRRVDGTRRPRRLAQSGIDAIDQWLTMLREALEKNYDRLDAILALEHGNEQSKQQQKQQPTQQPKKQHKKQHKKGETK